MFKVKTKGSKEKQLKLSKSLMEIFPFVQQTPKNNIELMTQDGYRIIVQRLIKPDNIEKTKLRKSLYGIFSHINISDEDIENAKKVWQKHNVSL